MHLPGRGLVNYTVKETDVAADNVVKREHGNAEVCVAKVFREASPVEVSSHMTGNLGDEVVERYARRQTACSLLNIEEIMTDVLIAIRFV